MGMVYAATDPELQRDVALKLVRRAGLAEGGERLLAEARTLAQLSHPNVVSVYDVGRYRDDVYVAMEYVEGSTLDEWIVAEQPSIAAILEVFIAAGRGLAAAHAVGVVHRDFKPANVMVETSGQARVLDFGLAAPPLESDAARNAAMGGTPAYMPPEVVAYESVDARADQFSFCVALYEALYGERPFDGATLHELLGAITDGRMRPVPDDPRIPAPVRAAITRGLQRDPGQRFGDMPALLAALGDRPEARFGPWLRWGLLLTGLAVTASWAATRSEPDCASVSRAVEAVWNADARRRVRDGIIGSGVGGAEAAARRTETQIDGLSQQWVSLRRRICESATEPDGWTPATRDAAIACLDRERRRLVELVDVIEHADPQVALAAADGIDLAGVRRCGDPRALTQRVPPDPVRTDVELGYDRLARVETLDRTGQPDRAWARVRPLLADARALGYDPLTARVLRIYGQIAEARSDFAVAADALEESFFMLQAGGEALEAARTAVELVDLEGYRRLDPEAAKRWTRHARALLSNAGPEPRLEATLEGSLASAARKAGDVDAALGHARRRVELLDALPDVPAATMAEAMGQLGVALRFASQPDEAEALLRESLEYARDAYGEAHPRYAFALNDLALLQLDRGELDAAEAAHRRVVEIHTAALGASHIDAINGLGNLANVFSAQGRGREAIATWRRVLEAIDDDPNPPPERVAFAELNLANALVMAGEAEEAIPIAERGLRARRRLFGDDSALVGYAHALLGSALFSAGRPDEGLREMLEGVGVLGRALGTEDREYALAANNVAYVLSTQARWEASQHWYEVAVRASEVAFGPDSVALALPLAGLGRVYGSRGDPERAVPVLERSLRIYESRGGRPIDVATARLWLAQVLEVQGGHAERVRTLAKAAAPVFEEAGDPDLTDALRLARP